MVKRGRAEWRLCFDEIIFPFLLNNNMEQVPDDIWQERLKVILFFPLRFQKYLMLCIYVYNYFSKHCVTFATWHRVSIMLVRVCFRKIHNLASAWTIHFWGLSCRWQTMLFWSPSSEQKNKTNPEVFLHLSRFFCESLCIPALYSCVMHFTFTLLHVILYKEVQKSAVLSVCISIRF